MQGHSRGPLPLFSHFLIHLSMSHQGECSLNISMFKPSHGQIHVLLLRAQPCATCPTQLLLPAFSLLDVPLGMPTFIGVQLLHESPPHKTCFFLPLVGCSHSLLLTTSAPTAAFSLRDKNICLLPTRSSLTSFVWQAHQSSYQSVHRTYQTPFHHGMHLLDPYAIFHLASSFCRCYRDVKPASILP